MIGFVSKKIPCLSGEYHEHGKGKKIPKLPKSAPKSMLDLESSGMSSALKVLSVSFFNICSNHLTHNKEYFGDHKSMVPIIVSRNIVSNCLSLEEKNVPL